MSEEMVTATNIVEMIDQAFDDGHEEGIKKGIEFAVFHFLKNLPMTISAEIHNKTVSYLIDNYKEINSYKVTK